MRRVSIQRKATMESSSVAQARFASGRRRSEAEMHLAESPLLTAQRKKLQTLMGGAYHRQEDQAGALQAKLDPVQRVEEEDPLQGKFHALQRVEEEEPLQGKFDPVQRVEEEEPLQGKFDALQRVEEEEPLQGKFEPVQRVEEEEPLQGRFAPESAAQMKEEAAAKPNNTGLPDNLKSGIESLSGMSMDNVKVHYNSAQPQQLNALAYAQGTDIHVAPGQEKHLPHEAWHIVQQAQGRVKPTMQMKQGVPVNDDKALEREADVMGAKAAAAGASVWRPHRAADPHTSVSSVQQHRAAKYVDPAARKHYADGWGGGYKVTKDADLKTKVPNTVTGDGEISLGRWFAPDSEQDPDDRRFAKDCQIIYGDGAKDNETKIFHCGPSGKKYWYDWPSST